MSNYKTDKQNKLSKNFQSILFAIIQTRVRLNSPANQSSAFDFIIIYKLYIKFWLTRLQKKKKRNKFSLSPTYFLSVWFGFCMWWPKVLALSSSWRFSDIYMCYIDLLFISFGVKKQARDHPCVFLLFFLSFIFPSIQIYLLALSDVFMEAKVCFFPWDWFALIWTVISGNPKRWLISFSWNTL